MDDIIPDEIVALLEKAPIKMSLLDGYVYSKNHNLYPIISSNIFAPNSSKFHSYGLFSEEIFGSITSDSRFITEAIINLNTNVIHPFIYSVIVKPRALYTNIISGKKNAIFDNEISDFVLSNSEEAQTGFSFFINNFHKLADIKTDSLRSRNKIDLINKYIKNLMINNLICIPAGLRDLDMKSSRLANDDINKIYMAIINLTNSLAGFQISDDMIFDGIRYQIQLKVNEVFEYILNIISGKKGFIQKHYGARKIAFSTRNVISATDNNADLPDDPTNIKSDESAIPMLNLIKCFQPFFVHYIKRNLYFELFRHGATDKIPVTDPETLGMTYITLKPSEINKCTTSEGITRLINQFKYVEFRESPIDITDINGKRFYLLLKYEVGDHVFINKDENGLQLSVEANKYEFNRDNVKPLTWIEFLYITGYMIAEKRFNFMTRYPVLEDGSIYPSRIHIITTNPSKKAIVIFNEAIRLKLPHYPIIGKPYFESVIPHSSRLKGMGADFDGDMTSNTTTWTDESNHDIKKEVNSISAVIDTNLKLKLSTGSDILNLVVFNLSRQDR